MDAISGGTTARSLRVFLSESPHTEEMGRACRPRGYIQSSRLRSTAVGKRRPTMFRKAMELFENCGVAVTLVTHYRGVYHFYNTGESGVKTVFEEYISAFETSPESFVVVVPDISTPADKKTEDDNTTCVDALEVPDFLADIGDLEMNLVDLEEINANFYAGGSILPAIVLEKQIVPVYLHPMPREGLHIGNTTPCVSANEEAPRMHKQAHKKARVEQENCRPVGKCNVPQEQQTVTSNKTIPKQIASTCVHKHNTSTTDEGCLQSDKHSVPLKKRKKRRRLHKTAMHVPITLQGSASTPEKPPKHAKLAKAVLACDEISSWLANVKENFAQNDTTRAIQRNDPIFAKFTKF